MIILSSPGELALKGKNRSFFERKLKENISYALADLKPRIKRLNGKFLIEISGNDWELVKKRIKTIFGISLFFPVHRAEGKSLKQLKEKLASALEKKRFYSFAVRAKNKDPATPEINSQTLNEELGRFIKDLSRAKVDLENPDLTIFVDKYPDCFYYYFEKETGAGGLPVGTTGKVLCLLSGGIDSPVAAYLMAKRGCQVDFVHFHAFANGKLALKSKVVKIFHILQNYTLHSRLFLLPYFPFQAEILKIQTENELVLFRRFILKVSTQLAKQHGYQALVTGDNLGQVASQTLENLSVTEKAVDLPLFRPLLCFDKNEIIKLARKIGTYEESIKPYKDCCSLIQKHPKTKVKLEKVLKEESKLDLNSAIKETLDQLLEP
jgi:thiamine biosynthesis protein ThiI